VASTSNAVGSLEPGPAAGVLDGFDIDEDSGVPAHEQIRAALAQSPGTVLELFREWDEDESGQVTKSEFRKAMPMLGLRAARADIDKLFDEWDPDCSGLLELEELEKLLAAPGPSAGAAPRPAMESIDNYQFSLQTDGGNYQITEFDHDAAKKKLTKYRKEQKAREEQKLARQMKEKELLMADLDAEEKRMAQYQQLRRDEVKRAQAEKLQKQREAREAAKAQREAVLQKKPKPSPDSVAKPKPEPLYKRAEREKMERERAAEEERKQKLLENRQHYQPIDFKEVQKHAHDPPPVVEFKSKRERMLPTLPQAKPPAYQGAAMQKMKEQHRAERNGAANAKEVARKRKEDQKMYSKLVHDLGPSDLKGPIAVPSSPAASATTVAGKGHDAAASASPAQPHKVVTEKSSSAPAGLTPEAQDVLARASELTKQAQQMEEQIKAQLAANADMSMDDSVLESRAKLSNTYIDAIKAKLELLEAVRLPANEGA